MTVGPSFVYIVLSLIIKLLISLINYSVQTLLASISYVLVGPVLPSSGPQRIHENLLSRKCLTCLCSWLGEQENVPHKPLTTGSIIGPGPQLLCFHLCSHLWHGCASYEQPPTGTAHCRYTEGRSVARGPGRPLRISLGSRIP